MRNNPTPRALPVVVVILFSALAIQCGGSSSPDPSASRKCPELDGRPTADDYYCEVQTMVDFDPRLTGSPGHKEFLDYIEDTLEESGFEVYEQVMNFPRWDAERSSLVLHTDGGDEEVTVAYPFGRSNFTGEEGLTLPLAYATDSTVADQEHESSSTTRSSRRITGSMAVRSATRMSQQPRRASRSYLLKSIRT